MTVVAQRLVAGQNGAIAPLTEGARIGYQFRPRDGAPGPERWASDPSAWLGAFQQARSDWRTHLTTTGQKAATQIAGQRSSLTALPPALR